MTARVRHLETGREGRAREGSGKFQTLEVCVACLTEHSATFDWSFVVVFLIEDVLEESITLFVEVVNLNLLLSTDCLCLRTRTS